MELLTSIWLANDLISKWSDIRTFQICSGYQTTCSHILCAMVIIGVNLGGQSNEANTFPIFFLPKNSFSGHWIENGQINNWGESGGKGCMYIKDWLKPILPVFLTDFFIHENSQYAWSIFWPSSHSNVFSHAAIMVDIKYFPSKKQN